jgi:hypothetical protein
MCGIAGIMYTYRHRPIEPGVLKAMEDAMHSQRARMRSSEDDPQAIVPQPGNHYGVPSTVRRERIVH